MNRILLEQMLKKMKKNLQEGNSIGDLKIGALYALGNQLEAIFYFLGHECGSFLDEQGISKSDIIEGLKSLSDKYHLGEFILLEHNPDHITFGLKQCKSCSEIDVPEISIPQGFCSFEAGLYAGIVEKITGKHCFAQELECRLQGKGEMCTFMIVIPND